jgi:hypothetical protein
MDFVFIQNHSLGHAQHDRIRRLSGRSRLYSIETPIGRVFYIEYTSSIRHPDRTEINITLDAAKLHVV